MDGIKTGFTNASGYNLMASAERNGRRVIAIMMGGSTGKSRDAHVRDLIEAAFLEIGGGAPASAKTTCGAGSLSVTVSRQPRRRTTWRWRSCAACRSRMPRWWPRWTMTAAFRMERDDRGRRRERLLEEVSEGDSEPL